MQSPTTTGETDAFGEITSLIDKERNCIHLFTERGYAPTSSLPDDLETPDGTWQFSAPYNRGAVIVTDGLLDDFPDLRDAFEALGHTTVSFNTDTVVRCMLDQLFEQGPYQTAEEIVEAFYRFDMNRGDHAAPELCLDDFNELHVEGAMSLSPSTARTLHTWINTQHPEFDFFLPDTPEETYNLAPLDSSP